MLAFRAVKRRRAGGAAMRGNEGVPAGGDFDISNGACISGSSHFIADIICNQTTRGKVQLLLFRGVGFEIVHGLAGNKITEHVSIKS